jgi:hypothetical protein
MIWGRSSVHRVFHKGDSTPFGGQVQVLEVALTLDAGVIRLKRTPKDLPEATGLKPATS